MRKKGNKSRFNALCRITVIFALIAGACSIADAVEIQTGNEDVELRWDNTIRYNFGVRTKSQADPIIKTPNIDDGDRNFPRGTVTNRLDILSEADVRFKKDYGARVSVALWYDQRYHDPLGNDSVDTSNHLYNGRQALGLSDYTKRMSGGPDGELLDAFVFGKFDLGEVPVNFKIGRQAVYWGESLMFNGALNGISYSQMPIDLAKAFQVPGSEAKELFRPLTNISAQAQLTSSVSVAGQWFLEWQPYRFPEAGSYLNNADILDYGGESLILGPGVFFTHGADLQPSGLQNWGASLRWTPEWWGGTFGLYYRNFADMLPQVHVNLARSEYFLAYADKIDLYGVSVSKEILGVSVGAELAYRRNMPLVSEAVIMLPGTPVPSQGDTLGARGDTWHANLNFLGLLTKTAMYDAATWAAEFSWCHLDHVTQGNQYFLGRDGYNNIDQATRDAVGTSINFTPTWYQVFPSMDLSMPLSLSMGLLGNSVVTFGDNYNAGNWSVGLSLDVYQKYNFTLQYVTFFGDYTTDPTGTFVAHNRGSQATLNDRDLLTFTFKFTY